LGLFEDVKSGTSRQSGFRRFGMIMVIVGEPLVFSMFRFVRCVFAGGSADERGYRSGEPRFRAAFAGIDIRKIPLFSH
jgi:hypothetical protein